ncbi:peroxide stress protein YaaA [Shewanella profunda]|uniref:peroxide stress protein YaaA n=1 Tax=Shewanella profunda TaxID=254793 RepID=UPI00200E34C9|nr:peroxide stress protein YaaA [Shewanella profunda]MCL1091248.1 peroxide stress protein YaaA [Shewanella profunda]
MLILVSPAKTLDFEQPPLTRVHSQPDFLLHSQELIQVCRQLAPSDIATLMKVSDKIAGLNAARFEEWQPQLTLENAKQAIFAFRGDVYTGFDADTLSLEELDRTQLQLRILSGLYGLLRPLDLMLPYRLEMGTALNNARGKNLYEFWGDILTLAVNKAVAKQGDNIIVNLASNEYFKAIKVKQLDGQLITPVFKDYKNGQYKVISFFAKRARGMMARYIISQHINSIDKLTKFDVAGYYYSEEHSTPSEPTFLREAQ